MQKKSNKKEFSKVLLIQESILIWVVTLLSFGLAIFCVTNGYNGDLPWITALVGLPWTAYGISQACYYSKSKKENTVGGIKYLTAEQQLESGENAG